MCAVFRFVLSGTFLRKFPQLSSVLEFSRGLFRGDDRKNGRRLIATSHDLLSLVTCVTSVTTEVTTVPPPTYSAMVRTTLEVGRSLTVGSFWSLRMSSSYDAIVLSESLGFMKTTL